MAFLLRPLSTLSRSIPRQPFLTATLPQVRRQPLSQTAQPLAQGYGDGAGDPKGENPLDQGPSNNTKQEAEHPGPPAPSEGQNTGSATKASNGAKNPEEASAQSGGSRSKEAKETGSSPTGGSVGGKRAFSTMSTRWAEEKGGAKPKISEKDSPGEGEDSVSEAKKREVEQHNKEFEKGHDRAPSVEVEEKVDKKFLKGTGGADKHP